MEGSPDRPFSPEISYEYVGITSVVAEFLCWNHVCFPYLCLYVDKKDGHCSMCLSFCLATEQNTLQGIKRKVPIGYQC